jgi:hypothetical protein
LRFHRTQIAGALLLALAGLLWLLIRYRALL